MMANMTATWWQTWWQYDPNPHHVQGSNRTCNRTVSTIMLL